MTLLTAGALTDPQLPATASNVFTTDVGWPPSQTKILTTPVVHDRLLTSTHDLVVSFTPCHGSATARG